MRNLLMVLSIRVLHAKRILFLWIVAFALRPISASALEKRSVAFDDSRPDAWDAGVTCRVSYYNICTGWVWCWSGFGDDYRFGVVSEQCCEEGAMSSLLQTSLFLCSSAPCFYPGFVGTIAVHAVDANDCPIDPPVAIQPYCPAFITFPFSVVSWGGVQVPNRFAVVVTTSEIIPSPAAFGSDHPAAGTTGPQACGACYPANRVTRSYRYGTTTSPICPGSPFNDGVCNAELIWDIDLACTVSVEETSWGTIKALYR